jgi:hypothetical protein
VPTETDLVTAELVDAYRVGDSKNVSERVSELVKRSGEQHTLDPAILDELLRSWKAAFQTREDNLPKVDNALADLGDWLGVKNRPEITLRRAAGWFFEHYAAVIGSVGILATAFYGVAYASFYRALGTTPDAVGVTTTQILARSAVGGVVFIVVATFLTAGVVAPYIPTLFALDAKLDDGGNWGRFGVVCVMAFAASGAWWLAASPPESNDPGAWLMVVVPLLAIPASLRLRKKLIFVQPRHLRIRGRDFTVVWAPALALAMLILIASVFSIANREGARAADGKSISPPTFFGQAVLGLDARPAFLTWMSQRPPGLHIPSCVLYLGKSDGGAVVYDASQGRTVRLPEGGVVVTARDNRTSCAAPVVTERPSIQLVHRGLYRCTEGDWDSYSEPVHKFTWFEDGLQTRTDAKAANLFRIDRHDAFLRIRCEVEATNESGADVSYSRYAVPTMKEVRPARLAGRSSLRPRQEGPSQGA